MSYIPLENCYKVTLEELRDIAADFHGIIHHVYAHWTAGHYSQAYDDYHICIDYDGSVYLTTEDFTVFVFTIALSSCTHQPARQQATCLRVTNS